MTNRYEPCTGRLVKDYQQTLLCIFGNCDWKHFTTAFSNSLVIIC